VTAATARVAALKVAARPTNAPTISRGCAEIEPREIARHRRRRVERLPQTLGSISSRGAAVPIEQQLRLRARQQHRLREHVEKGAHHRQAALAGT
jgi:hypothetical protein